MWTGATHKRDYHQAIDELNEQAKNYCLIHNLMPVHSIRGCSSRARKINGRVMHQVAVGYEMPRETYEYIKSMTGVLTGYGCDTAVGFLSRV